MKQNGYILILVTILLSIAIAVVATTISLGFLATYQTTSFNASEMAFFGAESGLQVGRLALEADRNYTGEQVTIGGVSVNITVTKPEPSLYRVSSQGSYEGSTRTLEIDLNQSLDMLEWRVVY